MIRTDKYQIARRAGRFQSLRCALGLHEYTIVGRRQEQLYHYSDAHEAAYTVTRTHEMLRCHCCGSETMRLGDVDFVEIGHYERVFVQQP